MESNGYKAFPSRILQVIRQTEIEYSFRMEFHGKAKPGQFFEVSIPQYGEAPISVSGIGPGYVELTIRRVGRVTNEVFERYVGECLFLRGPYGNGFDVERFRGRPLLIITGGTGLAPVRGVIEYFADRPQELKSMTVLASFKKQGDILFRQDMERWRKSMAVHVTLSREPKAGEYWSGRVSEHLAALLPPETNEAAAIVVGPPSLMHTTAELLLAQGLREENIWISEERKMCCGLGKCGHCRVNGHYICLDGPVFNYSIGKQLFD